jgi:hypothetical protein
VSNSLRTYFVQFIVSVPRKSECPIFEFEFLSKFFVNLLLKVIQVIIIYKVHKIILNKFCINLSDKIRVSDRTIQFL